MEPERSVAKPLIRGVVNQRGPDVHRKLCQCDEMSDLFGGQRTYCNNGKVQYIICCVIFAGLIYFFYAPNVDVVLLFILFENVFFLVCIM